MKGTVLLAGIVGSTAYGLAGPGSDVDRLGIFAAPTVEFHGLRTPDSTVDGATARQMLGGGDKDVTLHEVGKWCRLALACNPTVLELVWLPDDLYEVVTPLGRELIGIRSAFLSAKRIRDAYLGYATQQFRRIRDRGDGSFSADTRKRTAKHARHLARLISQGQGLYSTGRLDIRVNNPDWYREFGEEVAAGDLERAEAYLIDAGRFFDQARPAVPEEPDQAAVTDWLLNVRHEHYARGRAA